MAPLYQQALGQYGNIISQEPSAQNNAYQNAIQNFYAAISDASSLAAGIPPSANVSGGNYGGYAPSPDQINANEGYNPYAPPGDGTLPAPMPGAYTP